MLLTNRHALQSVRHHFDISLQMNKYFKLLIEITIKLVFLLILTLYDIIFKNLSQF